jgi:2-oxoglutarate dehydrogenase E2 component (dihydrolipoamide succinyltransferase)
MAEYNIVMPKMGESVQEATITKWLKQPGDVIEEDDVLLEIATDKVDSEIPSPVAGTLSKVLFPEGAKVPVGEIIAIINLEVSVTGLSDKKTDKNSVISKEDTIKDINSGKTDIKTHEYKASGRFYSPLVKSIAKKEKITPEELDNVKGTGRNGRVKKDDILLYLQGRGQKTSLVIEKETTGTAEPNQIKTLLMPGDEIIVMDRIRKMIAEHMVLSKQTSAHVTNFIEADVTSLVIWRDKVKDEFLRREKQKITFMPVFIEATAKALKEFSGVNASVDGDKIIIRKNINIGIAVALPTGNLIVPVIRNADQKSLLGITIEMNRLAEEARSNKLKPDDIQGGTFTITNFGTFRNTAGTPIINQPQVAILATGMIEKKPAVLETPSGDVIAIRHKMILSLSYDHRIIDGSLGGAFLRRIADILESFDINRTI